MELSVIIPTLNEEKYLPILLKSLKKQSYKNFEIIVSDANSEDKTKEIAKDFGCKLIVSKKRHPSCQRNEGAKNAKGSIFLFLDADTDIPKNFLEKTVKEFKKRNLIGAGFYMKVRTENKFHQKIVKVLNFFFYISQSIRPTSIGIAMLSTKEGYFKVCGFDETIFIGEDYEFTYKLFKKGKFRMIKDSFVYYSTRRLDKEGARAVLWKWIRAIFYVLFKGPIRKKIVEYEFGNYE
ncbi:glycosyltransferase [bacterium]|nr:glycosyltransferase [bacterium]